MGIVSAGMYIPSQFMEPEEIAERSGMPLWVVKEKLGIERKAVAGPDDQPNQMAVWAAQDALAKADLDPEEIDVVLCTTEEHKEYLLWTAGIDLAYRIGATRAWGIDLHMRCCTSVAALKIARDMMFADPEINTILIGGGYRVGDLINLKNTRTSFLFNISAGAGALIVKRNHPYNHVLGSHMITDGSMSRHVLVPASGTVQHPTDKAVEDGLFYFDLLEPEAMKNRLNEVSIDNWMFCVDEALRKSGGLAREDVTFLNMVLVKPSAHRDILERLGLTEAQTVYCSSYGHVGEQDSIINIVEGVKQGRLKDGDVMIIIGAGIGYVWGAACVKWGLCES
jgi:3-oxoacyl-[acyl-carrier-protein] synthase-3